MLTTVTHAYLSVLSDSDSKAIIQNLTEEREDWKRKLSTFGEYEDKTEYRNIIKRVFYFL